MLTLSTERFSKIQKEAPVDCQKYLVQVTKYQAAQKCKVIFDSWFLNSHQRSISLYTTRIDDSWKILDVDSREMDYA